MTNHFGTFLGHAPVERNLSQVPTFLSTMDAQAQSWQVPTAPAYPNYAMARQPSWKVRGGILKMFGIITEGIGILVPGLSIGYLVSVLNPDRRRSELSIQRRRDSSTCWKLGSSSPASVWSASALACTESLHN